MNVARGEVPRILWILWLQGLDGAPDLVQRCVRSWREHNPDWTIRLLDEDNLGEWFDGEELTRAHGEDLGTAALSDVIRIHLLRDHGGVWADAASFCCRPLDDWLPGYAREGFFAFRDPGVDRPLASWFLAAAPGSPLVERYCAAVDTFWANRRFTNQRREFGKFIDKHIHERLRRRSHTSSGFRLLYRTMLAARVYPYYWFHYVFADLLRRHADFRESWAAVPAFSADVPHRLRHFGMFREASDDLRREIDERHAPLYKLQWRDSETERPPGCALDYLLEAKS